jgi:hypothetical protein
MSFDSRFSQRPRTIHLRRSALLVLAFTIIAPAARADEAQPPANATPNARHGSAFVDPLGFLLFGPRIGVEAGTGQMTGALYGRWFDSGLLSRSMFLKTNDKFAFSYGFGARGRYYLADGMEGISVGVALEYLRTRIENNVDLTAATSTYVVPCAEAGYRMPFGQFYAGVSAALGYAFRASGTIENLPGGSSAKNFVAANESSIYGQASLELGVYF